MKKVLLHLIGSESIGGPRTVVKDICESYLKDKYDFRLLIQEDTCGLNIIKAISFVKKYKKRIESYDADVIYVCGLLYSGFLMTLSAKLSRIKKIVVAVHGSELDKTNRSRLKSFILGRIFEPLTVRMADDVFTVCEKELSNPSVRRGNRNNVRGVIYNVVPEIEASDFSFGSFRKSIGCPESKIVVAVVGRVVEDKGHKYIIDAVKRLEDDRYVFLIVGDGPYLEHYRNECQDLINDRRLYLLGLRNDVPQILRDSDIFLFATLHENHSKSLLEAVKMKCAVICTNVGGNPEIIDDTLGILIPPQDSLSILRALQVYSDSTIRHHFSERAYKVVSEKFSEKNTLGKLDALFAE